MPPLDDRLQRKSMLVVGPKRSRITSKDLHELRETITHTPNLQFVVGIVEELEGLWSTIAEALPELREVHGDVQLQCLSQFLKGGESSDVEAAAAQRHSVLLDVVTVLTHVLEFWHMATTEIDSGLFSCGGAQLPRSLQDIQGFCLGFLTAVAVASAKTNAEFELNVATILRIAVCTGALVELDRAGPRGENSEAGFLSVAWDSRDGYSRLREILSTYPGAYIACMTDHSRATVTICQSQASSIQIQLSSTGFSIQALDLQGRYHNRQIYGNGVARMEQLFQRDPRFQLPDAASLRLPLRSNIDGQLISETALEQIALDSILLEQCQWYQTVHQAVVYSDIQRGDIIRVGPEAIVPRSLSRAMSFGDGTAIYDNTASSEAMDGAANASDGGLSGSSVAVVGMACRYPDADSLEEFWELLTAGRSAFRPPPPEDRFKAADITREPRNPMWGNFVRNPDHFDHRFFDISGREAKNMDPQQRLVLQAAYETLESAGCFGVDSSPQRFPADVGCYLGVGAVDYADNIASHDATAFSALGTLRAFISGRVSHHFGWSGPSITYDTACSSGAVAIHAAVTAIKSNECSMALAGGVNVITSPALHQNLAAASFLSPTGASKAFDAGANGYCRGEGVGLVLLKSLRRAREDGDRVLAVIIGSAVNQGSNCSPITVPVPDSQSALYKKALSISGVKADEVSYIEAHGTGTPVGDPIECESIRRTFGGPNRRHNLFLGSVKDNIGHTEASSGAAALIKTILMMQKQTIPVQANFTRLNPKIAPLEPDRVAIPRTTQPWTASRRIAVVNNYGAAGSNAAIVMQAADLGNPLVKNRGIDVSTVAHEMPFYISAKTPSSLEEYCRVLQSAISSIKETHGDAAVPILAYNLSVKQNRAFQYSFSFTASTADEVASRLGRAGLSQFNHHVRRTVVLCIGGQTGRTVHLDEALFQASPCLRKHLDDCEQVCLALGVPSLYPAVFSPEPVEGLVSLHCQLFAVQYASAKSWLDCGLAVDTIIGHSFGQLTALVVAGGLSLLDGLRFIAERARLIQSLWGQETGAMLSIQGKRSAVDRVLERARSQYPSLTADVACYNGPQSIVLAGDRPSINSVEEVAGTDEFTRLLKVVRLSNTHAFHSCLVDGILPGLRDVADTLEFRQPQIDIEACSPGQDWNRQLDPEAIVSHSRAPVHFHEAVLRAAERLGPCVFLEAGSASPVVAMARRSLEAHETEHKHIFQPVDIGPPGSLGKLAKVTNGLWAAGTKVQHMPFCGNQDRYTWINLPPYQFEKISHWTEYKVPKTASPQAAQIVANGIEQPRQLLTPYEQTPNGSSTFVIDSTNAMFVHCTKGHAVLGQSLCPASMYVEVATRAANALAKSESASAIPCVKDLKISSPLSINSTRSIFLQMSPVGGVPETWSFTIFSRTQPSVTASTKHATGSICIAPQGTPFDEPRMRFIRRLVSQGKMDELMESRSSHTLSGSIVYQVFGQVVNYAPHYRGVAQIFSRDQEAVGITKRPANPLADMAESSCDPIALDNFLQVAGIHVNCLSERAAEEVFVCTEIGELLLSQAFMAKRRDIESYKVYSNFDRSKEKALVNDIFVFDSEKGELLAVFLGAMFQGVPMKSLAKVLANLNGSDDTTEAMQIPNRPLAALPRSETGQLTVSVAEATWEKSAATQDSTTKQADALTQVRELLSRIVEVPIEEVKGDTTLADLGVDSLMSTEVITEMRKHFSVHVPSEVFRDLIDVRSVSQLLLRNGPDGPTSHPQQCHDGRQTVMSSPQPGDPDDAVTPFDMTQVFLSRLLGIPTSEIAPGTTLDSLGIDSLMATDVLSELKKSFNVHISAEEFRDFQKVEDIAKRLAAPSSLSSGALTPQSSDDAHGKPNGTANGHLDGAMETAEPSAQIGSYARDSFASVRQDFDLVSPETQFAGFYHAVYPAQKELVVTYIVEAFEAMGCPLTALKKGDQVLDIPVLEKHQKVKQRVYEILEDAGIIKRLAAGGQLVRTATLVPRDSSTQLHRAIVTNFPQHAFEHNLLASTGAKLADCLTGKADPLAILFGSAEARKLMENVYANAPMFKTGTVLLARYLVDLVERGAGREPIRILELGAGTGGTTKHLVECLVKAKAALEYTFTDISSSLVAAARRKFGQYDFMRYATLDIEQEPDKQFLDHYDIVISTNCIHATADLTRSCSHISRVLRPDGVLCLVELTHGLFWFDLVFGLLEGWWLFQDGRQHALADEMLWRMHLSQSGFRWIDWTRGTSPESQVLRVITASPSDMGEPAATMETVVFGRAGDSVGGKGVELKADIYYPAKQSRDVQIRPIALMIHGGGHVMLSRKDIRPAQTRILLAAGFLPVSVDYRLCPETTLQDGPMRDVGDALAWARNELPRLPLRRRDIRADGGRVAVVGWSTGGHLALTLGFTSRSRGVRPPDAILAFYCPSDYEDPFWTKPNRPFGQGGGDGSSTETGNDGPAPPRRFDLLEGVRDRPITGYNPPASDRALGGWMSPRDPRSRVALHMNWTGRHLRVLLHGLQRDNDDSHGDGRTQGTDPTDALPEPSPELVRAVSPLAQIRRGAYAVPTFLVHGTEDDLIPWQQAVRTHAALRERGVVSEIRILDGAVHLFDLYRSYEHDESAKAAVREAYEFLRCQVL